jgi:DNA-binding transcriptional ArsR family regulator
MKNIQLDSRALRVLAHPLRARLLSELRLHGAANATALAERLGTNTGATSYHLRKLAEVGLVEETAEGTGKQRFWAAAQDSHSWQDTGYEGDPDAQGAASWLRRHYWQHVSERAARWEQEREHWPAPWQEAASMSDVIIEVNADRLRALMEELTAVVVRYRDEPPGEGSRQVIVNLFSMPADPEDAP